MKVYIKTNGKNINFITPRKTTLSDVQIIVRKKIVVIIVKKNKLFKTIKTSRLGNKLIMDKISLLEFKEKKQELKKVKKKKVIKIPIDKNCIVQIQKELL